MDHLPPGWTVDRDVVSGTALLRNARGAWCEVADAAVAMITPDAGDVLAAVMARADLSATVGEVTIDWTAGSATAPTIR